MKTGIFAAILAALMMATLGIFSRKIALSAEVVIFFRLFFGSLFLLVMLAIQRTQHQLFRQPNWRIVLSGFFLAAFAGCYFQAMSLTTLANAVIILYLAPVTASVFAHFFMNERLQPAGVLLIALALVGFAAIMEFTFHFAGNNSRGLIFALLSMIGYAAFICCNRSIPTGTPIYTKTFYQLLTGAIGILPLALAGGLTQAGQFSAETWLWLAAVGLFPGFLGIFMAVWALEKLPAVTFGTLSYLEPIFVVLFGWSLFGEKLTTLQTIGCGLILLSGILTGVLAAKGKTKRTIQAYDKSAGAYHAKFKNFPTYTKKIQEFQDKYIAKNSTILDVGCGSGRNIAAILQRDPSCQITGIDLSTEMLAIAKQNNPECSFLQEDIRSITHASQYDVILAAFCIVHLTTKETQQCIRHLSRALKKGGSLYISFMEGESSGFETTSFSKEEIFFHYYTTDSIQRILSQNDIVPVENSTEKYREEDGSITKEIFIFAKKQ